MKILQILPEFGLAGAEIMAESLTYSLLKLNHEVILVSFYSRITPITERLEKIGVKIYFLDKKTGFDYKILSKLREIFITEKPDVIHTHRYVLPYVYLAAINTGIKIIHTVHNIAEKEVSKKQIPIQKMLFKYFGVTPVAITPITRESIHNCYRIPLSKIPMIFNGIDLSGIRVKNGWSIEQKIKILHVGRFAPQKNHHMLIEMYAKVCEDYPNSILYLVGDGDLRGEIEKMVYERNLSENVIFVGLLDNVYDIMNKTDIFVLTSQYEGMPITLIEAMATGLPCVATRVGGIPDMITSNENGFLCEIDPNEFAKKVVELIEREDLRSKFGLSAKKKATIFSAERMAQEYVYLYTK